MEELENKYIDLLLKKCINFDKSKSLFISCNKVNRSFINKVIEKAKNMGIEDIFVDEEDYDIRIEKIKKLSLEEIDNDPYFNKNKWDEYALKGASFLMLETELPGMFDNLDLKKVARARFINRNTRNIFREKETTYQIPWCIAAIPNEIWAKNIFPNDNDAYEKLFKVICHMCMVDTLKPIESWENYLAQVDKKSQELNNMQISKLYYKNSLGTDLTVTMPKNCLWFSAADHLKDNMLVNMPSYEIFSTPDYRKTEGIVYSSKPLIYGGGLIKDFYIKFSKGKVIEYNAKIGYEVLKEIIESDEYSSYLGEVALVNNNSPIASTNLIFGTTLFDENASCHLALGGGFKKCIMNNENKSDEELQNLGLNLSHNHVDFMIGTSDLSIEADTNRGRQLIFKNGNFIK